LRHAVERLARERGSAQTRHERETLIQKLREISLRTWGANPLQRDGKHHLADGRSVLGAVVAAGTIDVADEIELLGHPQQCTDVPDRSRADGPRITKVYLTR
jgi:hypothetical protein